MKTLFAVILLALLLAGCSTIPNLEAQKGSRTYSSNYPTVFQAVLYYCEDNGLAVVQSNKDLGIINTDYSPGSGHRTKIMFSITKEANGQTKVSFTTASQSQNIFNGNWNESFMNDTYANVFNNKVLGDISKLCRTR